MKKNSDYFWYFLALLVFIWGYQYTNNKTVNNYAPSSQVYNFDKLKDPEQTPFFNTNNETLSLEDKNSKFNIYPQANYKIYAMVMSKHHYYFDWNSKLSPYDLALAWNELMLPQNQKGIKYWQSGRWYYFQYNNSFPLQQSYVEQHSANNHIIPANKNVLEAIKRVNKGDKIYLEGYLVYIEGKINGSTVSWHSSLTRNDTGDGSCEVFYVKKAVLNNIVYQ